MNIEDEAARDRVQRFWGSPSIASRPVSRRSICSGRSARPDQGAVDHVYQPVDSLPEADQVRDALAICPFVVVSDMARLTDTTPMRMSCSRPWAGAEKDGTVTNSERRISRQRAFLPPPAKHGRIGGRSPNGTPDGLFRLRSCQPVAVFREHAALSAFENHGTRDFDIGAWARPAMPIMQSFAPLHGPSPPAHAR